MEDVKRETITTFKHIIVYIYLLIKKIYINYNTIKILDGGCMESIKKKKEKNTKNKLLV